MDLGLRERVYLVTGGTAGLGLATARALVGDGARVVVSGRRSEAVAAAVASLGQAAVGVPADNADPQTPARLIEAAEQAWGRLDGALISVGGPPAGGVLDASEQQWREGFESVFLGALRLAREVAARLGEGGALAFVLSSSVKSPIAGLGISNGLRPGLAMVAKSLADELGPAGIRVNGLLPGTVFTDRIAYLTGAANPEEAGTPVGVPLGRYGEPEEFGRVAAFLLSPAASFVSGSMVPVDGGALRSL